MEAGVLVLVDAFIQGWFVKEGIKKKDENVIGLHHNMVAGIAKGNRTEDIHASRTLVVSCG